MRHGCTAEHSLAIATLSKIIFSQRSRDPSSVDANQYSEASPPYRDGMRNMKSVDRILRLMLGASLGLLAYFWLASPWSLLAYALAVIMTATAVLGTCPIYKLLGLEPRGTIKSMSATSIGLSALLFAVIVLGGSYGSAFFTRKIFLEDFNAMNHFYKQTLFLTGKAQRAEALANFDNLKPSFAAFTDKYRAYRPYGLKSDTQLEPDFSAVGKIIADVEPLVRTGDLHQAHLDLEKVRPIFQGMFKRNGFSMLSVALVDFHDAMELILDAANAKDATKVSTLYPEISDKLKVVEAEANDDEVKAIRTALEDLLSSAQAAQSDALPGKGDVLKSSFVKVYLKRG